jgi:hypothetical protein
LIRNILAGVLVGSLALGLSACGRDPGTRAVTGGLMGAGGGAAIGALGGGALGAGAGALTTPQRPAYGYGY